MGCVLSASFACDWPRERLSAVYPCIRALILRSVIAQPTLISILFALRHLMMRPPPGGTPGQSRSMSALQYLIACCIWFDCAATAAGSDKITIADAAATTNLRKAIGPSLEARIRTAKKLD
jgi:hypothetical protein